MMFPQRPRRTSRAVCYLLFEMVALAASASHLHAVEPCRIDIVDAENGWPVSLIELRTTHNERFVSDNNGIIAFDLPD